MRYTIIFLTIITITFISCSKYSGPEFNSANNSGGTNNNGAGNNGGAGNDESSFSFKLDGVQYTGSKPAGTKKVSNGGNISVSPGYEFVRNGKTYRFFINFLKYTGKGTYSGATDILNMTSAVGFNLLNSDINTDTAWINQEMPQIHTINVTFDDDKYIEATFDATVDIRVMVGGVNTKVGSAAITEGKIKIKLIN